MLKSLLSWLTSQQRSRKRKIKDSEWIKFFLIIKITMSTILKFKEFKTIDDGTGTYTKDLLFK